MSKELRKKAEESSFLSFVDAQGRYADFHALCKTFITNLSKSGLSPKLALSLARHSDINLTMNVYTDFVLEDQAVAVELLPSLPSLATFLPATVPTKVPGILNHLAELRDRATRKTATKSEQV